MQLNLTGFLEKNAAKFTKELWEMLINAQSTGSGIPQILLEEKRQELMAKKVSFSKHFV